MAYAIRYQSEGHQGMLIEMPIKALRRAEKAQREAFDRIEAWHDTPDCARPARCPDACPYPHYEGVSPNRAHQWVRNDWPHETLLYISEGRMRRA
jgi:hypothetical protein